MPGEQGLEKTRGRKEWGTEGLRGFEDLGAQGRIQDLFLQQEQPSWESW